MCEGNTGQTTGTRATPSPSGGSVTHKIVAICGHHIRAHGLGADEVERVRQSLPHVAEVVHHLRVPLDHRTDGDAALDYCYTGVLSKRSGHQIIGLPDGQTQGRRDRLSYRQGCGQRKCIHYSGENGRRRHATTIQQL